MPPSPGVRIIDHDGTFLSGVKSDSDPGQVPLGYFWMGVNVINTGGSLSCRPGYRCIVTLPDGNLQGLFIFHPEEGLEQAMVVIDGVVYVAPWPFIELRPLPNVQLSPYAKQVYWSQAVQSAERIDDSFTSKIRVIDSKAVVFIQDGGLTAPAWYDGSNSGHVSGTPYGTPAGGDMVWVGDRLWVARNHQVFASDIANPFSFRESDYLGGQTSFFFRSDVTAMTVTPSTEAPQLMVFTDLNGSILQSNIRDRSLWNSTPNFQEEVIGVGCLSSRSVTSHYGRLTWYSPSGVAFYDPATSGKLTTRLPMRDNEMLVSKATLSDDLSRVAAGTFGQYLLMSVPAEDHYNRHTWVLNHASYATLNDESGPSWNGYWIGTRPVEWASGQVANVDRIFHVSVDFDGKNRLWEAFTPDRLDNKCPITWGIFTRGYFGPTASVQSKPPGSRCRLAWVDLAFTAIEEDLNLGVFYAGGTRGAYRQMMNKLISVERGSLKYNEGLEGDTQVYSFKAQSRQLRTEDANQQSSDDEQGSCGVETPDQDNIDRDFQLLIVGHGPATLKWVRPFAFLIPEDVSGEATACEDEVPYNAVRFDGVGAKDSTYSEITANLAARALADYTSQQTVTVEQDDFLAVGVGFGESIVSQEAADRVASIIATKMAENELSIALPPITSIGLGLPVASYDQSRSGGSIIPNTAPSGAGCPAVLFAPIPDGAAWHPYSAQLQTGDWGIAPITFQQVTGGAPSGITVSPTGLVSGTPTVFGTFRFDVRARDATGKMCTQEVILAITPASTDVDWNQLVWDTPVVHGGLFPSVAGSGDHMTYNLQGSNIFIGNEDAVGSIVSRLTHSGSASTHRLQLNVTFDGNLAACSLHIQVLQDGVSRLDINTVGPGNPPIGTTNYPFALVEGVNTLIEVRFDGFSPKGAQQRLGGGFQIVNT